MKIALLALAALALTGCSQTDDNTKTPRDYAKIWIEETGIDATGVSCDRDVCDVATRYITIIRLYCVGRCHKLPEYQ